MSQNVAVSSEILIERAGYLPKKGLELVKKAADYATECHNGQKRQSGDPTITHPLSAALTVADLQLDAVTIAAALLHDVKEDCAITDEMLNTRFGPEIAKLVDGVTKLGQIPWPEPDQRFGDDHIQAENLRKMFLAMAQDLRVVIVKLADRLHNMRTLYALSPEDQQRISKETMEIYAPLASRLGIWEIKWQLEDLAFRYLQPEQYKLIAQMIDTKRRERESWVAEVSDVLRAELERHGLKPDVKGRAKHIYSIYQKMEKYGREGKSLNEIYDLGAVRILVDTADQCYMALGVVHGLWRPIPGTFDDYIANPKDSMYQSLHSTVMSLNAKPLEVQIRTYEMHRIAEYGVASHWRYKEGTSRDVRYEERLAWLRQLLDWHREISQAEELVEAVKTDIFQDQVFVFTPKGEIKDLPKGATPLDFAYRIHTDLGHHCVGGKVNGKLVSLNAELKNGDVVEILTSRSSKGPSRDWLNAHLGYVRTSHGRDKVRQWFKRQERAENIARGHEMLEKELHRIGVSLAEVQDEILRLFPYDNLDDFCLQLGYGGISTQQLTSKLVPLVQAQEPATVAPPLRRTFPTGVSVLGTGDLLTRLARCCDPVPGDPIVGYVTRGEGVTIHRKDCSNVLHEDEKQRLVEVAWGERGQMYPVAIHIEAWDRVGLLRDISTLVAEDRVNMVGVHTQEKDDGMIAIFVTLETDGVEQLTRVLNKLESIRGIISVDRQLEGAKSPR
ncbi:MAG TPA: bifunctional (p)ppGpp synthetase/guanosine-3',5'-bis(diphosphate) 3'-pyrophosphohydrolase [Dehalococcoidia bacterium]|nr:bifunctional (p)ppGpp synthetase/guanosine-3',5'-bis(diphosphate) 3'-pyrophosphohydrolase [Dehalococcoidia bacterium]